MQPTYKKNKTLNPMLYRRSTESVCKKLEEKGQLVATPMSPKRARHEIMESETSRKHKRLEENEESLANPTSPKQTSFKHVMEFFYHRKWKL